MTERIEILTPPVPRRWPAVAFPTDGVRLDQDMMVYVLRQMAGDFDDEEPYEPTEEEIDSSLVPCPGWRAWGDACLVCHDDAPEGQAVAYPFIFGSRACIGDCAAHVDSLLKIHDRSRRGRWRPTRQVHTLANGARCNVPHEEAV